MRIVLTALALLLAGAAARPTHAQATGTVAGRVTDSATSLPRTGVIVSVDGVGRTVSTDAQGRYLVARVPVGNAIVRFRQIGYDQVIRSIPVSEGDTTRLNVSMLRDATVLGEVRAEARSADRESFRNRPELGAITLTAAAMSALPRIGEADPIRIVQLMPGVQARNDFTTGLNVRGGESDQNLVLLDGIPIYNPFHLGGMFSTFIGSAVSGMRVMTAAFPAQFGDRLSSVLDVHSQEDLRRGVHGTVDLSVVAATGLLSGSFAQGKGTWSLAGRRTYADAVARAANSDAIPYHFRDEQSHITYDITPRTRLSVTIYDGRDLLDGSFAQLSDSAHRGAAGGAFIYSWGNAAAGATLSSTRTSPTLFGGRALGDSLRLEHRVYTTRFSTSLDIGSGSATLRNDLRDTRIGSTLVSFTPSHDRTIGYELAWASVDYASAATEAILDAHGKAQRPRNAALFVDDVWRARPSLLLSLGARGESLRDQPLLVSPRASLKWLSSDRSAFTLAAGRYTQWMHALSIEDNPIHIYDIWQASDATSPVSHAWQLAAGHERWFGTSRVLRLELFDKRYRDLLEYNTEEDPSVDGDEFHPAEGTSFGGDVMLRQVGDGPLTGWLSYTWQQSVRIRDGLRYTPSQDRRHDANLVLTWRGRSFTSTLRAGYASGMPYTDVTGEVQRRWWDPFRNEWGTGRRAQPQALHAQRNAVRLPATKRVDLYIERPFKWRGLQLAPFVSVVNATNAHNVLYYKYDYYTVPGQRQGVSQLPFFPSAGVTGAF